ncbi:MAG: hypothetical protein Q4B54_12610 [Coriobacteriales bacterium]|nr:hypothetical protein [Coriobacteriales bacterium]
MKDSELRKALLNGKKTERINFALTPELKAAVLKLAEEQCITVSSLIVGLLVDESLKNKELVGSDER